MGGTGIIDQFLETFTRYIDSGFGLLGGEVGYLATTLAAIDVTLAGLFWAWGADEDIMTRLVKKTLFVGVFAFLIGNWNSLARIIFESFAGLGLKASGTVLSSADFLRPGKIAQVGLDAGRPILDSISGLMGYVSFFENFIQISVLLFAWVVVLLAFFILAIQLFITLIEFKLTTLAGFVLIPFGLFGKTAFAAERVLGNVISSGVKVLVLAVIVGMAQRCLRSLPQASVAISRPSTTPWRSCSGPLPFSAWAFLDRELPTASCRADRSSAPAPRSAPAWPPGAPSSLALVSQPVARDWQVVRFSPAPAAQPQ
jgi:P-type conjugative transfer protein TrbL